MMKILLVLSAVLGAAAVSVTPTLASGNAAGQYAGSASSQSSGGAAGIQLACGCYGGP